MLRMVIKIIIVLWIFISNFTYLMPPSKTKQLAKKLGFMKRGRELVNGRDGNKKRRVQLFSHIIVLDFESTCWKDKRGGQEIIEFPGVLIDVGTCKILAEFQQYVQPQEKPMLSSFCTELTGISQEQVNNGVPLPTCLMLFNKWLKKMEEGNNFKILMPGESYSDGNQNRCVLATWTDWDFEVCLKYECNRKRIKKPSYFNHWIDIKATYKNFYERKPAGVKGALQDLGIEFEGREHCGLDDARNTASLCIKLIEDGCQLKITKSIQNGEAITNVCSSPRPCQLPQPVVKVPSSVSKEQSPVQQSALPHVRDTDENHEDGFDNDSFNMPTDVWLDISIPDVESRVKIPMTDPTMTVGQASNNVKSLIGTVVHVTERESSKLHSFVSPISNLSTRQTSTPITQDTTPRLSVGGSNSRLLVGSSSSIISVGVSNSRLSVGGSSSKLLVGSNSSPSLFKTPSICNSRYTPSGESTGCSLVGSRITPPLCKCGKRTKRKLVTADGPNEGKPFYSCCMSRLKGCGFFEWESLVMRKHSDFTPELLSSEYD